MSSIFTAGRLQSTRLLMKHLISILLEFGIAPRVDGEAAHPLHAFAWVAQYPLDRGHAFLRPRLLAGLEKGVQAALLADIYLRDKEWDAAWAVAENIKSPFPAWAGGWGNLKLHVAQASDKHCPEKAIPVYLDAAERLIAQRGRENYATAAGYLRRARDLFSATHQSGEWQETIANLRERHRNLPALQDELRKAGL